jgi:diguanylate cyclase (GGDEF)-like protein
MAFTADDVRREIGNFVRLIEAKEYFAVAESRRFRAAQRRLTWSAARAGMLVIAVAAPIHVVVLSILHPSDATLIVAIDGSLGIVALAAWWALGRRLRHQAEAVSFAITLGIAFAAMVLAFSSPHTVALAIAYLMFLPTLVALVIPWRTYTEVRWLAVYGSATVAFLALVPAGPGVSLSLIDRSDLIVALVVMLAASFTGHVLLVRQQIRMFSQLQAIVRLHRSENSQRIELERVYRSLEVTARTDELTRVANRLRLDEDLVTVRARVGRTGRPFGMLEVDLDHFKAVNDRLGHLAGDAVLRRVAAVLRDTVRADDAVYRYGGEEFLVILGNIAGGVEAAAERVRLAVQDLGLAHPANEPHGVVTVSVGAVALGPADLDMTADEWFARVDGALYEAKAAGRNRIAVATPIDGVSDVPRAGSSAGRAIASSTLSQAG